MRVDRLDPIADTLPLGRFCPHPCHLPTWTSRLPPLPVAQLAPVATERLGSGCCSADVCHHARAQGAVLSWFSPTSRPPTGITGFLGESPQ